jgi:hypothetical protein
VGAFRETAYPSSAQPDQIALSWSEDPRSTQTVQWRTHTGVKDGQVQYRIKNTKAILKLNASMEVIQDRMLMNDRYMHHYTAVLRGLRPATIYQYSVGSPTSGIWSEEVEFTTAPADDRAFSFMYTGDTHHSTSWGELLNAGFKRYPELAFNVIGGDVVSTGLDRNEWDDIFEFGKNVYNQRPLAYSLGNHDDQDGLGAWLPLALCQFPANGPKGVERGRMYSFQYGNAEFFIVDVGTPHHIVTAWLEEQLSASDATWKFFVYHFPLYNDGEEDYSAVAAQWAPLFDTYHVDISFHGHCHRYFRTKPIRGGKVVESPADGTIYLHTSAVASQEPIFGGEDIVAKSMGRGQLYQKLDIDGNKLTYRTYDIEGTVHDEFVLEK